MKAMRWVLPLVSLAAVLWFTWRDVHDVWRGPGPLHSAHAAVPALAGGAACEACHRPGAGVDAEACLACHQRIAAQRGTGVGLHGAMRAEDLARCEHCHGEHHGDAVPLLAPHAFARAGVADPARYDHTHVAFGLTGVHASLECAACHPHADAAAPPAGGRFLGGTQACSSCHDDAHRGAFGGACAECHGQERPFREVPGFTHERLPLRGAHAAVACVACHAPGSAHDVAAMRVAPAPSAAPARTCAACHADPHGGAGPARTLRLADTQDCARCHPPTSWSAARPSAVAHAQSGFALHGPHATVACAACHGDAAAPVRWGSAAAPAPAACGACHAHPHRAELIAAADAPLRTDPGAATTANVKVPGKRVPGVANAPSGCSACHHEQDATFAAGRINAAQHAAIGFALAAPHAEVACASCHRGETFAARFPGRAAADCRGCHADVHGGQFAQARHAQCTSCHASSHWLPHRFDVAAHGAGPFPLDGAHAAVACQACHRERIDGHRVFRGTTTRCAACHADAHRGAFDRAGRPVTVDGRGDCARCHQPAAWSALVAPFDHAAWTGHALLGAHAGLACARCHAPANGRHFGPASGSTCSACHPDPHAGQFATAGATDCARCHEPTAWSALRFDHGRDSRFALDGVHARLACSKCHVAYPTAAGPLVRYKPLGTACGDCHRLGADGARR